MKKIINQALVLISFFLLSGACMAECRHFPTDVVGIDDGPGSYGPLDATMTLDCLELIEVGQIYGRYYGIIRDDRGTEHWVKIGTYIGVGGVILGITHDKLIIELPIEESGQWKLTIREMKLKK